jgi:isoaspartyl peptidase/L-asparaginase-like protein (Ntn-hydrolase superfamily)
MTRKNYALALHGGAGPKPGRDYSEVEKHLDLLIRSGQELLENGVSAVDVVERMVRALETSGFYVAGRGAGPNNQGEYELDASIMDGASMKAGAVAAIRNLEYPISGARSVMDKTPYVMLAGEGAETHCREQGLAFVEAPEHHYRVPVGATPHELKTEELMHGTVGAVALDQDGNLAAATSTGGLFGKPQGRVGDTPIIGIGTWADKDIAVSCTGVGEHFILAGGARVVADRMKYGGLSASAAAATMLDEVASFGGDGGLIAITRDGEVILPFNSDGMKRAYVFGGQISVKTF